MFHATMIWMLRAIGLAPEIICPCWR